ncbi:MAG: MFS transporter [Candidatus Levybacteria bacterium]|nr:MFS transporter [Candidatus Levybacteria bacterium]
MEVLKRLVKRNDILRVLKIKSFSLMMLSEFFSQLAFNMQHFVLIFIIYGLTRSNTAVSGMILSFMVPAVLFSVITGVYVDRWNKKKILLYTHIIRSVLILPFLFSDLHLGFIYILTFLIAVATQFFIPAESAIIPQLVPRKLIVSANAVFAFGLYGSTFLGYILSGPILLLLGQTSTIIFLVALFVVSAFFVAMMKFEDKKKKVLSDDSNRQLSNNPFSIAKEASEIFHFIRKARKVMHALFMLTIAQAVIFMFAVLTPGYVTTILEEPLESLSLILIAPAGLGLGLGAIILGSMGKRIKNKWVSAVGFMIVGIVFVILPLAGRFASYGFIHGLNNFLPQILDINILHVIVVLAFIIGFSISLVFIPSNATIQIETNEEMRGRMYGLLSSLIGAVSFLPVVLAGGLADLIGVGAVITGVGALMIILSIFYLFLIKF